MPSFALHNGALASLLVFGWPLLAQAQTIPNISGSVATTGIVGVTSTQSARLNVLSLQPVIPGVAATLCPATLEFYDETGALLKQLVVTNISPATAASLVFKPTVPSTAVNARAQVRAVVFTPSTATAIPGSEPPPVRVFLAGTGCNVMPSLEIIDDLTGVTHTFTTDLRGMSTYRFLPMPGVGPLH